MPDMLSETGTDPFAGRTPSHSGKADRPRPRVRAKRGRAAGSNPAQFRGRLQHVARDTKRILIIDGHPDPAPDRFVHALADYYAEGAAAGGYEVRRLPIATMGLAPLATRREWEAGEASAVCAEAQQEIARAEHIVIVYPLWLGDMPALLKAFFEQVMRPGFAFRYRENGLPEKMLKGRTAHVVVTMGMPALAYRLYYGAHSVRSLERNIPEFRRHRARAPDADRQCRGQQGGP